MKKFDEKKKYQEKSYTFPYHFLDLASEEYKYIWNIEYLNMLELVQDLLKLYGEEKILDAGCGDGRFCFLLRKSKNKTVGVDYSEQSISFAKAFNPMSKFYVQSLENLDIVDRFDSVVFIETLEHIPPKKIPQVLKRLSSVLKKDGKIVITVPSENLPILKKHYQHFTKEKLVNVLSEYFEVEKILGFTKSGLIYQVYILLRSLGLFMYPFRTRLKSVYSYFFWLNRFYKKHLMIGQPEQCFNLIAICKKK